MQIYDLKDVEKCFVCGNIDRNMDRFIHILTSSLSNYEEIVHPKELERQKRLIETRNEAHRRMFKMDYGLAKRGLRTCDNSVIIVSGNCGIGSKSEQYYNELFEKLNTILEKNNCHLFFVRGNNDDPSYFIEHKIDFRNIKTIPDYSVIVLKFFNCLCIGGSVSLDKEWKLSQKETFGKTLYWENEEPIFDEKSLTEILEKFKIGCVISSTCPSFVFPSTNSINRSKWIKGSPKIKNSMSKERKTMDKIYEKIVDVDTKPYIWLYGRFKQHNFTKTNDIVFDSLTPFQMENVNSLITSFFGVDLSKKLGGNNFALDSFIGEEKTALKNDAFEEFEEDEEELVEGEEETEIVAQQIDTMAQRMGTIAQRMGTDPIGTIDAPNVEDRVHTIDRLNEFLMANYRINNEGLFTVDYETR